MRKQKRGTAAVQSFEELAKSAGCDENPKAFDATLKRLVPAAPSKPPKKAARKKRTKRPA